jgi:hypothetical protein
MYYTKSIIIYDKIFESKNIVTSITFMEKNVNSTKDIMDKMNDEGKIGVEIIKLCIGFLPKLVKVIKSNLIAQKD